MNLKSVNGLGVQLIVSLSCAVHAMSFSTAHAEEATQSLGTAPAEEAPVAESQTQGAQEDTPSSGTTQASPQWVFHWHGVLGAARTSAFEQFQSDRLGAGLFAGTIVSDFELPLFLADARELSLGFSYHTFTGVSVAADASVSLQSLGAQARFLLSPNFLSGADLSLHGGLALQRLVAERNLNQQESTKLGGALTAGAYARWVLVGPVVLLAGADLVAGTASWGGLSAGVETSF
jgi:hypothetical protein